MTRTTRSRALHVEIRWGHDLDAAAPVVYGRWSGSTRRMSMAKMRAGWAPRKARHPDMRPARQRWPQTTGTPNIRLDRTGSRHG